MTHIDLYIDTSLMYLLLGLLAWLPVLVLALGTARYRNSEEWPAILVLPVALLGVMGTACVGYGLIASLLQGFGG